METFRKGAPNPRCVYRWAGDRRRKNRFQLEAVQQHLTPAYGVMIIQSTVAKSQGFGIKSQASGVKSQTVKHNGPGVKTKKNKPSGVAM